MDKHDKQPVVVLGALNLDMCGIPRDNAFHMHDSNPGSIVLSAGGVGHNIARHIAQAGIEVQLISLLGDDYAANILSRYCSAEGVGLTYTTRRPGPSSTYLCVHDNTGDLVIAVNDMTLMDSFLPDNLKACMPLINSAPLVCTDANLPEETMEYLAEHATVPLLLDPVSGFKAERARKVIGKFTAVKPNQLEAEQLSGETDPERAADWFLSQGTKHVYISLGDAGLFYADASDRGLIKATKMRVQNTSGAGDSLAAGIAMGMLHGMDTRACALLGIRTVTQHLLKQGGILE